jgi:arylsulfatase A-like enzyme
MNVLLLLIDSLRADHLSSFGYHTPTSPFLDRLAAEGASFDHFFTPAIPTLPAYTSMFTGQSPVTHRVLTRTGGTDILNAPWVPKIMAEHGYVTAAVDILAQRRQWCARGFSHYFNLRTREDEYLNCFQLNRVAMPWLEEHRRDPFFLYIHYGDPHTPYAPPLKYRGLFYEGDPTRANRGSLDEFRKGLPLIGGPLNESLVDSWLVSGASEWPGASGHRIEDVEWCKAQYDAAIRAVDGGIAELLGFLDEMDLAADTAVIVLGDHGESLGEHGIYFAHHGLYECTLRPPLIVRWPGMVEAGRRITALTQIPDIGPTLLEMMGLPVPESMDGRSLVPLLRGQTDEHVHSEIVAAECTVMFKWALRKDGYKLIVARQPDIYGRPPIELYDLGADPAEQINLAADRPDLRDQLLTEFQAWLSRRLIETGQTVDPVAFQGKARYKRMRRSLMRKHVKQALRSLLSGESRPKIWTGLPRPWPIAKVLCL